MLANVQQTTIQPIIAATVATSALVHTDEYGICARLPAWGYQHKTVCHARGEYARDEDGDGFCEGHVNTMEGFWSLLLAPPAPGPLARQAAALSRLLPGRPQRAPAWESPAQRPCRRPGCMRQPHHPGSRQEPLGLYIVVALLSILVLHHSLGAAGLRAFLVTFPSVAFFGVPIFEGLFGKASLLSIASADVLASVTIVPLTVVLMEIHVQHAPGSEVKQVGVLIRNGLVNSFVKPMVWAPLLG